MQRRERSLALSLGGNLTKRIKSSRVLLVGAGGIGCELLKNLVCCGFGTGYTTSGDAVVPESDQIPNDRLAAKIVVVDLDTIDLSNLNRQFLFRKHHIKKPKATVAKETAAQFNPAAAIDAHHASIFDKQYNVDFFASFDIVFNALDNLAARRHVNRMCLAANVPLVESGTTGYDGQVQVIQRGLTECYDCNPKPVAKSYPICTIRSTPSQPIHCIVWAKSYLFPELFGASEEDSSDVAITDADNADEVRKLKEEAEALKNIRGMMGKSEFAQTVFDKVFHDDIERLKSMGEMWQNRKPPSPFKFEALRKGNDLSQEGKALVSQDQSLWSLEDNLAVFCYSLDMLSARAQSGESVLEFDKDDKDTLDFVASAANIRAHVFGLQTHSEWEIKQMAGNIIPAIATSNALTASLSVLQAFKVLRSLPERAEGTSEEAAKNDAPTTKISSATDHGTELLKGAKFVFLSSRSTERLIVADNLRRPNAQCAVCSPYYAKLGLPCGALVQLSELVSVLKDQFGYDDFSISSDIGVIYDPDLDDNLEKPLKDLGIDTDSNGFVTVVDDSDTPKVDLVLSITESQITMGSSESSPRLQIIPSHTTLPAKIVPETHEPVDETSQPKVLPHHSGSPTGLKRKREADEESGDPVMSKKAKQDDEVVEIEDGGAIILDD